MTPWLDDGDIQLYHGDAAAILQQLPAGIAQTCITSPPYWGLRDYGTGTWTGGDDACDHARPTTTYNHGFNERWGQGAGEKKQERKSEGQYAQLCAVCGAQRADSQLGLEATPDQYVERMVSVFREVRRCLRDDGTLWLNLGDSYAASGATGHGGWDGNNKNPDGSPRRNRQAGDEWMRSPTAVSGLKPKDLAGIPWKVAFALQADGWYLRSDIIWSKPNPMPESVTDRPTKAHEYLFLLTKGPRYFYDADAIREPHEIGPNTHDKGRSEGTPHEKPDLVRPAYPIRPGGRVYNPAGRNRRSVWTIPTEPFPEAHFATYPQALVQPCIQAGSKPGDLCLDPFVGSGTTCLVARKHGRRCIGIDLSAEYLAIAAERTRQLSLLNTEEAT